MRIENHQAMEYYFKKVVEKHWSTRQLERSIKLFCYERLLTKKQNTLQNKTSIEEVQPKKSVEDIYVLEFLSLSEILRSKTDVQ